MNNSKIAALALSIVATMASAGGLAAAQSKAVAAAAESFLATLTEEQRSATILPLDTKSPNSEAIRKRAVAGTFSGAFHEYEPNF